MNKRTYQLLLAALLAVLVMVPALFGPFQHDDFGNLPRLQVGPFSLDAAIDVAVRNESGPLRRPLSNLSLATDYWMHGLSDPFWFKLTNLVIHVLTGLLCFVVARHVFRLLVAPTDSHVGSIAAAATALVWFAHPLQVSTTFYVVQRMAQLATLFSFVAIWALLRWLGSAQPSRHAHLWTIFGYFAATALAIASKENGALIPLLAGSIFFVCALRSKLPINGAQRTVIWATAIIPCLMGLAVAAALPGLFFDGYASRPFTPPERIATQAIVLFHYLKLIVIPYVPWMALNRDDFPQFSPTDLQAVLAMGGWVVVLVFSLLGARRWPVLSLGILWFLAAHAMESTIIPLEMVYEHRNYLALFGPALIMGFAFARLWVSSVEFRRLGWLIPMLVIFGGTLHRSIQWSSPQRFYESEFRRHPDSFRALLGMYTVSQLEGGYTDEIRALHDEIISRRKDLIWVELFRAQQQCTRAFEVDWNSMSRMLKTKSDDDRFTEFAGVLTNEVVMGRCPGLDRAGLGQVLEAGYFRAFVLGEARKAEQLASYRAWILKVSGESAAAEQWFRKGAHANPQAVEPLFNLAYQLLNSGQADAVSKVLKEIRQRIAKHNLPVTYRAKEVADHLTTLRCEQGTAIEMAACKIPSSPTR